MSARSREIAKRARLARDLATGLRWQAAELLAENIEMRTEARRLRQLARGLRPAA